MNTIDCNTYRERFNDIKYLTELKKGNVNDMMTDIGLYAHSTGVPVIVIAHFIGEIYGLTPQIESYIARTMGFYRIDHLIPLNKGQ